MKKNIGYFVLILSFTFGRSIPCPYSVSVDITDGEKQENGAILKDGVLYDPSNFYEQDDVTLGCPCNLKKCIRKCCAADEIMVNKNCTKSERRVLIPIHANTDLQHHLDMKNESHRDFDFFYLHSRCNRSIRLEPEEEPSDVFFIQANGSLFAPYLGMDELLGPHGYCVDVFDDQIMDNQFTALLCNDEVTTEQAIQEITTKFYFSGMIISMPFLLVTFLVYALLPDRNLHMKALMCYVINLLHAYIFLVTIQLTDEVFEDTVCAILGYCCVFFFLASFFWMNVICVDIFLGFRGFRGVPGVRSSERKRFILYCIYAWGMSLLIVFITFMVNHFGNVGQWFYPGVAVGQCFIRNGIPQLLYFYGPMGIIIILNVVLFTLTAMRIRRVKKDTAMLKHSESKRHSDDDQQNFNLYLKLLLAMGVNWSMELVSWAVNLNNKAVPQYVWYLSDFCNATYGVFIFFIFVFKRNIWKQLRRRYYSFMGRHHMAHSMGTTNFTKTTNDSMTVSTNDRALEESELNGTRIN
ncbi:G-protein coupled receptor Mth2-like isoform X1 [Coccinella septempunctata]|uniref:G-protein coupled receptor Mth2-like isoform X1 n=1 Tax=Coccinella septempunctata TaxID=41139 RepID=UPI001D05E04A|nr:G-protein coupled receptor Mth2-like isoform X1 [Coccinella septempunctata]